MLPTHRVPQITSWVPSSTTRLFGILKKSVALVAFFDMKANRRARQGDPPPQHAGDHRPPDT